MKATICTLMLALVGCGIFGSPVSAQQGASQGTVVAVVDVAVVFDQHTRFKTRMDQIKAEVERFDNELKIQQEAILERATALNNLPPSSVEYKQLEAELAQQEAELQIAAAQKRKEVLDQEAITYLETYNEVIGTVTSIAEANNISLVLRYDSSTIDPTDRNSVIKGVNRNVVLNRGYDLTEMVIEIVNRESEARGFGNDVNRLP